MSNLIKKVDDNHVEYKGHIYHLHGKYYVRNVRQINNPDKWTYEYLHRAVYKDNFGEIPKGFVVHHKDENTHNNSPRNLKLLSNEEHTSLHFSGRVLTAEHKSKITGRPPNPHSKNQQRLKKHKPQVQENPRYGWAFPSLW